MSWLRRYQDLIALLTAAAQGNAFEVYLRTSTMLSDGDFKWFLGMLWLNVVEFSEMYWTVIELLLNNSLIQW